MDYMAYPIRVVTFRNVKKDIVFKWIFINPINAVAAIHSVGADGNCGFRAVALEVYHDQSKWIKVKQDMLEIYLRYCNTLYKPVDEAAIDSERAKMIRRLNSVKSPCLKEEDYPLWFSTFSCPQVVADAYQRPVILYTYVNYKLKKTGEMKENDEAQVFFPLVNMEMANANKPIALLLSESHFYSVEFCRTPTGRMKKFDKPALNLDHHRLRQLYPEICVQDYSVLY